MSKASERAWSSGLIAGSLLLALPLLLPACGPSRPTRAVAPTPRQRPSDPARGQQIKVLTRALALMHTNFQKFRYAIPSPVDIFDYQVGDLWRRGIDGSGTTVALIEGWSDPKIGRFMAGHDAMFGLPKAQITTIYPTGDHKLPATCPPGMVKLGNYGSCHGWVGELRLDVLAVHLMAPYAKILITVAPADSERTDDAASQVLPPELMQAIEYLAAHHLANVISISDDTGESTYSLGKPELYAENPGELAAAAAGIPVLVGTGDCDAAQHLPVGPDNCRAGTTTSGRATAAWDDSPWVTAVGGTTPNLTSAGKRAGSDRVFNFSPSGQGFGEGAGFSADYARPGYQDDVAAITKSRHRSVPDLAMDASGGTSESTPLLGGVLALAAQLNHGENVGPINPLLYTVLGPRGLRDGIADVVAGNNSVFRNGRVVLRGFSARKGFDVASGWGTIRANTFAPALAKATQAAHQDASVRRLAATALAKLERRMTLSRDLVGPGQTTLLTARGFLPLHPVTLTIDRRTVATLHASRSGTVSFRIRPAALGLPAGKHAIALASMLLVVSGTFRTR